MSEFDELLARLTKTEAPCPPMLARAAGYTGDARFVALYWGGGDECYADDGVYGGTGHYQAYLLYTRHNAVWPHLAGYQFGSSDEPAVHWLLLDREGGTVYAGPARDVHRVLLSQRPHHLQPDAGGDEASAGTDWREAFAEFMDGFRAQDEAWNAMTSAEQMRQVRADLAELAERDRRLGEWLDAQDTSRAQALLQEFRAQLERSIQDGTPPPRPPAW